MATKTATYGNWKVIRHEDNKMEVYKEGQLCPKSAPALREIAEEIGLAIKSEWRTSQLGANVVRAMMALENGKQLQSAAASENKGDCSLINFLRDYIIIETEDDVYYDSDREEDYFKDMFINNIVAQCWKEEKNIFKNLKFQDADSLIKYLDEDPDGLSLAYKIVAAAYCACLEIEIEEDTRIVRDSVLYYFNCNGFPNGFGDFHYEYETDIDLG